MAQRTQIATKMTQKNTKLELRGRLGGPKWHMAAPGRVAPAHGGPKMAPRGPLGTPKRVQVAPKVAQDDAKMAQVDDKMAQEGA